MSCGCNLNKPEQGKYKDKTTVQSKKSEKSHGNKKEYPHSSLPFSRRYIFSQRLSRMAKGREVSYDFFCHVTERGFFMFKSNRPKKR